MKSLLLSAICLTFAGCAHNPYKHLAGEVDQNGLSKFVDKNEGVVCYVYENSDAPSLSCLKQGE